MSKFHARSAFDIENAIASLQEAYFILAEKGELDLKTNEFRKELSETEREILKCLHNAHFPLIDAMGIDTYQHPRLNLNRKYEIAMFSRHEA